jgi:hypothetical protein
VRQQVLDPDHSPGLQIDPKEYSFPFEKIGRDGSDISGLAVGASMTPGEFDLKADNVRLR